MDNDRLMTALERWAGEEAKIEPTSFDCSYYSRCNTSAGGQLWGGNGCMMSYIGCRYGSTSSGHGFRLAIVGMDHGEATGENFSTCRSNMEKVYQVGGGNFNPHYKGVVKTASAVFGNTGAYCRENCQKSCQKSRDAGANGCVMDRIAQPNLVKCAPKNQAGRKSRATRKMYINCVHHLIAELQLLSPNLIVVQYVNARDVMRPALQKHGVDLEPVGEVSDRYGPVLFRSKMLKCHLLFLYHPAYNNLTRQWVPVVEPALNYLRTRQLIPA
jgi:hypothetical protein